MAERVESTSKGGCAIGCLIPWGPPRFTGGASVQQQEGKPQTADNDSQPKRVAFDYEQQVGPLTYKSRAVILFHQGMSYLIDFTATPGTFDKNLPVFIAFCKHIKFLDAQESKDNAQKVQQDDADHP